jgi:hypothetical protein
MRELPWFLVFNGIKSRGRAYAEVQLLDQSKAWGQLLWHEEKNQVGQAPAISKAVNFNQISKSAKIEYTSIMRPLRERLSMIKSCIFFIFFLHHRGEQSVKLDWFRFFHHSCLLNIFFNHTQFKCIRSGEKMSDWFVKPKTLTIPDIMLVHSQILP